jgi:hypothetical protein
MQKIVVLDTNVLLADPNALMSFPRAEVVIPETVLGELDKLKTARVDPDLRFRGREVSRILFDLSEEGSLVDGVAMPDGGLLRVVALDGDTETPDGLSMRNADDRVLASVFRVKADAEADAEVTLVTNDLNMLLKAQTLGIDVQRYGDGDEGGWTKRFVIRPFQRYRVPLGILAIAVAVFVAVVVLLIWGPGALRSGGNTVPPEFRQLLTEGQQQAYVYLTALQRNPNDAEALLGLANYYYDQNRNAVNGNQAAAALVFGQEGLPYYERYLDVKADDDNARSDYAALLFYTGQTDRAIQQVGTVLAQDPKNVSANFNLGVFYWQGNRQDLKAAANQFQKVIELTASDQKQHAAYQGAVVDLEAVRKQAAAQGITIDTTTTLAP